MSDSTHVQYLVVNWKSFIWFPPWFCNVSCIYKKHPENCHWMSVLVKLPGALMWTLTSPPKTSGKIPPPTTQEIHPNHHLTLNPAFTISQGILVSGYPGYPIPKQPPRSTLVGGFNPFEKYISQNGNLPQIGVKIKNIWNHHLVQQRNFSRENGIISSLNHQKKHPDANQLTLTKFPKPSFFPPEIKNNTHPLFLLFFYAKTNKQKIKWFTQKAPKQKETVASDYYHPPREKRNKNIYLTLKKPEKARKKNHRLSSAVPCRGAVPRADGASQKSLLINGTSPPRATFFPKVFFTVRRTLLETGVEWLEDGWLVWWKCGEVVKV